MVILTKQSKLMVYMVDELSKISDLEMTKDVKERFAMEPCRVAKVFVDRHLFTLKIVKNQVRASS